MVLSGIAIINDNFKNNLINLISVPYWSHNYLTNLREMYIDSLGEGVKIMRVELDPTDCILDYMTIPTVSLPYHERGIAIPDNSCVGGYRLTKVSRVNKIDHNSNFLETFNIKNVMFDYLQFKILKLANIRLFYIHSVKRYLIVSATDEELTDIYYKLTISNKFKNDKDKIFIFDMSMDKVEVEIRDVIIFTERELKRKRNISPDTEALDLLITLILGTEVDEYFYNLYNLSL